MRQTLLLLVSALAFLAFTNPTLLPVQYRTMAGPLALAGSEPAKYKTAGLISRAHFDDSVRNIYHRIGLEQYGLSYEVFRLGLLGYYSLEHEGATNGKGLVTIIDFSKPSTEKRFYTIDLKNLQLKYQTYVAHGRNTGQNIATEFSNIPHSNKSSLGFYVTGETYVGSKGYSLRLDGREKNYNDKIRSRAVVIHPANYATEEWIKRYGRLGRSQGCPALPPAISREVIDLIKDKTVIFTYHPDESYLCTSPYLQIERVLEKMNQKQLNLPQTASVS